MMRRTPTPILAGLLALLAPVAAAAQVVPGTTLMGFTHDTPTSTQRYELCADDRCEALEVTAAEGQQRFVAPAWLPAAVAVPLRIRAVWAGGTVDSPAVTFSTIQPPPAPGPPVIVEAPPDEGGEGPDPDPDNGEPFPVPDGDHGYFDALVGRTDHWRSYSLRDDAMLRPGNQGGYTHSNDPTRIPRVTYDPTNDPDPRRQDAAKVVVPEGSNNLRNQVRLPIDTGTDGFLLTWDVWFGAEWDNERTAIDSQKTWQLQSGGGIWTEIRNRYRQASNNVHDALAFVDMRRYGSSSETSGNRIADGYGDVNYGSDSIGGQLVNFPLYAETWTRYWVRITPRGGESPWWDLSLWVADEDRAPVQLHRNSGIRPANEKGWEMFWLEFNTSDGPAVVGRGDLVAYVRNVVLLRNPPADMTALLVPPSVTTEGAL